ncbi:hypothetical protein [Sporolactobacillus terrae]|nr:hypothetical protein [Sporolactobacillus terrae]
MISEKQKNQRLSDPQKSAPSRHGKMPIHELITVTAVEHSID